MISRTSTTTAPTASPVTVGDSVPQPLRDKVISFEASDGVPLSGLLLGTGVPSAGTCGRR